MSWMDSWSRPAKSQATPAPYYLLPGGESTPYCRSCGRVISPRRRVKAGGAEASSTTTTTTTTANGNNNSNTTTTSNAHTTSTTDTAAAKYCSARCRHHRPRKLDREIEAAFVRFLMGQEQEQVPAEDKQQQQVGPQESKVKKAKKAGQKKAVKGDPRILVACDEVEKAVFSNQEKKEMISEKEGDQAAEDAQEANNDHDEAHRNPTSDGDRLWAEEEGEEQDKPYIDGDVLARLSIRSGARIRPAQDVSEVNGSVGGEKGWAERVEETEEMARKRFEGQRRAQHKEMVRSAARRGVAFGFETEGDGNEGSRRKCEAVMQGKVVEPSFAKGNWAIRWRE